MAPNTICSNADILTGRYADDFESGEDSDDVRSSGSENTEIVTQSQHNKPVVSWCWVRSIHIPVCNRCDFELLYIIYRIVVVNQSVILSIRPSQNGLNWREISINELTCFFFSLSCSTTRSVKWYSYTWNDVRIFFRKLNQIQKIILPDCSSIVWFLLLSAYSPPIPCHANFTNGY